MAAAAEEDTALFTAMGFGTVESLDYSRFETQRTSSISTWTFPNIWRNVST